MRLGTGRAVVIAVFLGSITTVALTLIGAQTPGPPAPAAPSPSNPPAAPQPAVQKPRASGSWRNYHYGESSSTPAAEPRQSGGWRHFGDAGNAPPSPQELPAWRYPGVAPPREPGPTSAREMEGQMYELVNRDRADPANAAETNGRALALRWNDRLAAVARAHSLDMLNRGYFSHQDPQGGSVATRVAAAGLDWQTVGENIAIYTTVARAEAAFMNEPRFTKNHRGNILNPSFTEVGIGIVPAPDGRLYITQDFYTPSPRPAAR